MNNDKKLNALRAAMHDLADDYVSAEQRGFADTLREVADDFKMLQRFSNLLTHYDTPKAAADAMRAEAAKRIDGSRASADLSGRHTASIIYRPVPNLVETSYVETMRGEFIDMRSSED